MTLLVQQQFKHKFKNYYQYKNKMSGILQELHSKNIVSFEVLDSKNVILYYFFPDVLSFFKIQYLLMSNFIIGLWDEKILSYQMTKIFIYFDDLD